MLEGRGVMRQCSERVAAVLLAETAKGARAGGPALAEELSRRGGVGRSSMLEFLSAVGVEEGLGDAPTGSTERAPELQGSFELSSGDLVVRTWRLCAA